MTDHRPRLPRIEPEPTISGDHMLRNPDHGREQHVHIGRAVVRWICAHRGLLAAVVVLAVGGTVCFGAGVDRNEEATGPGATITTSYPATPTTSPPSAGAPTSTTPAPAEPSRPVTPAEEAVWAFAWEFGTPGSGADDWWARVSQWSSPRLTELLRTTDWRRLDATTVTGVDLESGGVLVADFVVTLDDHSALGVRALFLSGDWRVDEVAPMRNRY